VAGDDGGSAAVRLDHGGDIACEVVQRDALHRPRAAADAARLRP
jgi:hypothetical protein